MRRWAEHRWARRRLSDYIDDELPARARRRVRAHADVCSDCGPSLRSLTRVVRALCALPDLERPRGAAGVISRLRSELADPGPRRPGGVR